MSTWTEFLEENGPEETADAMVAMVEADVHLKSAVLVMGLEWCISRLQEILDTKGQVPTILDQLFSFKYANHDSPNQNGSGAEIERMARD